MNRNQAKEFYPILQAFIDGKELEVYSPSKDTWVDVKIKDEIYLGNNYRIKPESKFRPFKDAEECWNEMEKHQPFGWVKSKEDGSLSLITLIISEENIDINCIGGFTSDIIMKRFTFDDGAVFGILEEE